MTVEEYGIDVCTDCHMMVDALTADNGGGICPHCGANTDNRTVVQ